MSQHHAVLIDELWSETERLQARVEELQSQLAQSQRAELQNEASHDEDVCRVLGRETPVGFLHTRERRTSRARAPA